MVNLIHYPYDDDDPEMQKEYVRVLFHYDFIFSHPVNERDINLIARYFMEIFKPEVEVAFFYSIESDPCIGNVKRAMLKGRYRRHYEGKTMIDMGCYSLLTKQQFNMFLRIHNGFIKRILIYEDRFGEYGTKEVYRNILDLALKEVGIRKGSAHFIVDHYYGIH